MHLTIILLRVFVAAGTCLPSRCLTPKRGTHLIELLPYNDRGDTYTDTQADERE
jgi:hypothetical protein